MTNVRSRLLSLAAALTLLASICITPTIAHAQSPMVADIPFDFLVGTLKLPPGRYTVVHMANPAVLKIYDTNGHASVTISNGLYNRKSPHDGQLVFTRYGELYFLSEVRWTDTPLSRQLMRSSLETQIARNIKAQRVIAASNR
jgi:phosphoglycerate-specific signal transduction histidine kinase